MKYLTLRRLRWLSQVVFFSLFLFLLFSTEFRGSFGTSEVPIRLPYPVSIFLEIDPLNALTNVLATGALYKGLIWSLVILIPTFFLGRFFCGWICPLGSLNHFFSSFWSEGKRGRRLIESSHYKPWQRLKYYILVAVLVSAVLGSQLSGLLDPISLIVRSFALSLIPGLNYALNAAFAAGEGTGFSAGRAVSDVVHFVLNATILSFKQPHFRQGFLLGSLFIVIALANLRVTRFWCRALCPLGALLGLVSRWSIFGLQKTPSRCDECNRCLMHCQGGDDPMPGRKWRKAECHLCFNCVGDCPTEGLEFTFFPSTQATVQTLQLQRRRVLTGLAAGVGVIPLLRSGAGLDVDANPTLVRPPGAVDERHFLERCIRCGECMKVCPNNALHPTLLEAGVEGLWTPVLVPRIGYCEPSCVLCSQVCPTGAIWEITPEQKMGRGPTGGGQPAEPPIKIGTAFYDRGRCLPWAMGTECIVCEEWCPTSPKAIQLQLAEVVDASGDVKYLRQPHVDVKQCTGCGACEFACPVRDRPAVYVTSVGESRSATNQILLEGTAAPRKGAR